MENRTLIKSEGVSGEQVGGPIRKPSSRNHRVGSGFFGFGRMAGEIQTVCGPSVSNARSRLRNLINHHPQEASLVGTQGLANQTKRPAPNGGHRGLRGVCYGKIGKRQIGQFKKRRQVAVQNKARELGKSFPDIRDVRAARRKRARESQINQTRRGWQWPFDL